MLCVSSNKPLVFKVLLKSKRSHSRSTSGEAPPLIDALVVSSIDANPISSSFTASSSSPVLILAPSYKHPCCSTSTSIDVDTPIRSSDDRAASKSAVDSSRSRLNIHKPEFRPASPVVHSPSSCTSRG